MTVTEMQPAVAAPRQLLAVAELAGLAQRSDIAGFARLGAHLATLAATALLVYVTMPYWYLLIPAMVLHGFAIVSLFAPMHECVHRTAFASHRVNVVVGWLAGVLSFYNSTYYWHFHSWHHRYTQDPARDPELMFPKAKNWSEYVKELSGVTFWWRRILDYPRFALGRTHGLPFVPAAARRPIALSMTAQLAIYAAAAVSIAFGHTAVLYYWILPALLAQPLLRALLICEHTGCSLDANGLSNTRTTLASFPVRLLMWNMPFHAEHHLYPNIPFHRLPELHVQVKDRLAHLAPGYPAANRAVFNALLVK